MSTLVLVVLPMSLRLWVLVSLRRIFANGLVSVNNQIHLYETRLSTWKETLERATTSSKTRNEDDGMTPPGVISSMYAMHFFCSVLVDMEMTLL